MAEFEAHNLAEDGDVLVISGVSGVSNMGGISALTGQRQGERGAIVMGGIRDVAHSRSSGYPLWASEITPITGKWRLETVEINGEIQMGDVRVNPGDLVIADDTGVVFVPRADIMRVLELCEKKKGGEDTRIGSHQGRRAGAGVLQQGSERQRSTCTAHTGQSHCPANKKPQSSICRSGRIDDQDDRPLSGGVVLARRGIRVAAEPWPTRPVTIIVPFPPGISTDILARAVGAALGDKLGQPFVVGEPAWRQRQCRRPRRSQSPRPTATPLFFGTLGPTVTNKFVYKNIGYDPDRAFAPIIMMGASPLIIVGSPKLPAKNLAELIEHAKKNLGKLNAGTVGVGSQAHIVLEMINKLAGTSIVHVPYRIATQALPDLISGDLAGGLQLHPDLRAERAAGRHPRSRGHEPRPRRATCRTCRRSTDPDFEASRPAAGTRCSRRPARRRRSSTSSTPR